jgi:hypothetical protein
MPSVDDSSTLTLVDVSVFLQRCGQDFTYAFKVPGLVPSFVLSIKELDEEWESFRPPAPESPPKKRGPVVAPSFDPHFTSTSGAMQMVGLDAPVKKKGIRGWLEGFVRKS